MASSVNNTGVNPGGGRVQSTPAAFGNLEPLIGNGYGSLFAKLEMLDKSMENSESPDEHVSRLSSAGNDNLSKVEIFLEKIRGLRDMKEDE